MTERKPGGMSFESWIDRQIREAQERGEFDNLPGAGKPLSSLSEPHDEMWWVKQWLRRENVSFVPPTLALRKAREVAMDAIAQAETEQSVRKIVTELNAKIVDANRTAASGPATSLMPLDLEAVVESWRRQRSGPEQPTAAP